MPNERKYPLLPLLGVLFYFFLQMIIRAAISPALEADEAQQIVWSQYLLPGYGPQPPLYTWLLYPLVRLFGPGVLPLAILKNILLATTCLCTWGIVRESGGSRSAAAAGMMFLFLVPQFAWESQRDLTHSVLVMTLAAGTLLLTLRALRSGGVYYVLLGICAAAGILAKYNFAFFLIGLLAAAASIPATRSLYAPMNFTRFITPFVAVAAWPLWWMSTHPAASMATSGKLGMMEYGMKTIASGAGGYLRAVALFIGILVALTALPLLRNLKIGSTPEIALVGRTALFGVLICGLLVVVAGVTSFKDRWMQPLLYPFIPYLAARLELIGAETVSRRLAALGGIAALTVAFVLPARVAGGNLIHHPDRLSVSWNDAASVLAASGYPDTILTDSCFVGGNLKLILPKATVISSDSSVHVRPAAGRTVCVVWRGGNGKMSEGLKQLAAQAGVATLTTPERMMLPYRGFRDRGMPIWVAKGTVVEK